jgi:hypothetical protein
MSIFHETRIGGSKTMDVIARQWENEGQIDYIVKERRTMTPQGQIFEDLLMRVAPYAVGKVPPDQVILYCKALSAMARETLAEVPMSISTPSQDTLRRKIAKRKEKTNG